MRLLSCSHKILELRIKTEATHRSLQVTTTAGSNIQRDLKHEELKQAGPSKHWKFITCYMRTDEHLEVSKGHSSNDRGEPAVSYR